MQPTGHADGTPPPAPRAGNDEPLTALRHQLAAIAAGLAGRLAVVVQRPEDAAPLIDLRGDAVYSSASIIKLPILWAFLEQADAGSLDTVEGWVLQDQHRVDGTGVLRYLGAGASLTLLDLATLMTVVSDNTATNALIDRLGVGTVQAVIDRLGLTATRLGRKMYDFEARARGLENVTCARDIAALLRRIATGDGLSPGAAAQARTILLGQQFNAGLPARLPDETPVAHKTGNVPGLLHDAGWIEHPRGRVIVVAFTDGLANAGDGAVALAAIGEAVWRWLDTA